MKLFGDIYSGKSILVTGDTGFKGSWLVLWLQHLGANVTGYSDGRKLRSHSHFLKLDYKSERGDIRDVKKLNNIVRRSKPDLIFHLAAQSLVRESYRDPLETYSTNVLGTANLYNAALKNGIGAIVSVTTDKVYENSERGVPFKEGDPLGGYDIYSSSKACVEILSSSFSRSFFEENGTILSTVRAGNVIGGGDWANERLVPDLMLAAATRSVTEIRNPNSIRPWQHVLEPISGYLLLGSKLLLGKKSFAGAWNFGPADEDCKSVGEVTRMFAKNWPRIKVISKKSKEHFHEAGVLRLDQNKAEEILKWHPVWTLEKAVSRTANWYKQYYEHRNIITESDLATYIKDAKARQFAWVN